MRVGFEPGDGSFEVVLEHNEPVPPEWNIPGAVILRESTPIYRVIKPLGEVLEPGGPDGMD